MELLWPVLFRYVGKLSFAVKQEEEEDEEGGDRQDTDKLRYLGRMIMIILLC